MCLFNTLHAFSKNIPAYSTWVSRRQTMANCRRKSPLSWIPNQFERARGLGKRQRKNICRGGWGAINMHGENCLHSVRRSRCQGLAPLAPPFSCFSFATGRCILVLGWAEAVVSCPFVGLNLLRGREGGQINEREDMSAEGTQIATSRSIDLPPDVVFTDGILGYR